MDKDVKRLDVVQLQKISDLIKDEFGKVIDQFILYEKAVVGLMNMIQTRIDNPNGGDE